MSRSQPNRLGAAHRGGGRTEFLVWAPSAKTIELHLVAPEDRLLPLERGEAGYFHTVAEGAAPGSRYFYRLNGERERPDPASRFQPEGVHGPSQIVDPEFPWTDGEWRGLPLDEYILYELHVGTFSEAGTFEGVIPHLDALCTLGVTAIELMPVAQFPGERNWGYDGVQLFAVQNSYGGPEGLKRLVDACHARGLAIVLDVVYNHVGPEGNRLKEFAPYFQSRYHTPWGPAINFDGAHSDEVRRFFIENALYWVEEYHFDALRLDAVHAILDPSPRTFLEELADAVHERAAALNRRVFLFPESDQNDPRLVRSPQNGGYGLDAVWTDDLHHALHVLLTGERTGYYVDFGGMADLAKSLREGFVYTGEYSKYRRRSHGRSARDVPAFRHIVCAQNHDQVGNRMLGDRLSSLVSFEKLKVAAGLVLLSPYIPLLFMGEEYGEEAPFLYFISLSEDALIEAVRKGRRRDFAAFRWKGTPPDPQNVETFLRCRLNHDLRREGRHRALWSYYQELIRLRKNHPALSHLSKENVETAAFESEGVIKIRRWRRGVEAAAIVRLEGPASPASVPLPAGEWRKILDSEESRWAGGGSEVPEHLQSEGEVTLPLRPHSLVLYSKRD